ncbi:type II toxin-antitoxin system RnlB family antitoxin [Flavobacterium branchiophilum]|uniref:Uncharacterized protein n=1 Tax=Flavobacterium branchiophilum TaxID=55197 RepID=A0A2H3K8A3_9FLAO|nr:type II toxin-antitoxin system RnlB family antitoxin [Flavobacterium branchiophilum]PDS21728.1 hypothetical protein B0A77_15220 [Flavobacterium branchiophilum]
MERSNYILKYIDNNQYNFVLISKDMCRLQEYISFVEEDLKKHNKESFVLLDLLLNNNLEDRYYRCYFDGNKLIRKSLSKVSINEINHELVSLTSLYYLNHEELFEDVFFSKEYKSHIFQNLENQIQK